MVAGLIHDFLPGEPPVEPTRSVRAEEPTFTKRYDALMAEAVMLGVCPKICQATDGLSAMHYCGRPLDGQFCAKHRWGV